LLGGPAHLHHILPLLEKYCGEEEIVVRDTAVHSLAAIIPLLPKADLTGKFIPILKRLANGDWFTTRVSATGLFAACYPHVPDAVQSDLRSLFNNLCNDDTPMVRKSAFTQLGPYALTLQRQYLKSDVYPIVKAIAVDDMDSMRVYAIDACASLVTIVDANDYANVLLPIIEALQDDASWRVRQALATSFGRLCNSTAVTWDAVGKRLFALYMKLLKDKEPEVRTAACQHLDAFIIALARDQTATASTASSSTATTSAASTSSNASSSSSTSAVPPPLPPLNSTAVASIREALDQNQSLLDSLTTDSTQNVKVAYSKAITGLCPVLGKELSVKLIVPLLAALSKDEYYEVRHYIFSRLYLLAEYLGAANLSSHILPIVVELSKDSKWRVRYNIIDQSALLARHLGQAQFNKRILPVLIAALSDHVYAIRQLSCRQLGVIVKMKEYGGKWAVDKMLSSALVLYDKTTNYLHRMTCLLLIEECIKERGMEHLDPVDAIGERDPTSTLLAQSSTQLAGENGTSSAAGGGATDEAEMAEMVDKTCLPIVVTACTDDVPNVRLAAAKCAITLLDSGRMDRKTVASRLGGLLQKMTQDSDPDVSYFAHVAVRKCQ